MVLFTSCRSLSEAANIRAVYEAYKGSKAFEIMNPRRDNLRHKLNYDLLVTDEIPKYSTAPVIMICHGASAGKHYGLSQPYPYVTKKDTDLLTFVLSSSRQTIPYVAAWADCDEKRVLPYGMPRMDKYIGKKKGDGGTILSKYKRSYLFCPTYRTHEEGSFPKIDWTYIDSFLTDDELLVVKCHPETFITPNLADYEHIREVSAKEPTWPYIVDCDVFVTDYSTTMFDAHVLGKPVVLFERDWERYNVKRGMSLDYPDMYSSWHCRSETDLLLLLRTAKRTKHDEYIKDYVCGACDGHSTKRVVDLINKIGGSNK